MNCGLSRQDSDFSANGDSYTFIQKQTTLDYILFDKFVLKKKNKWSLPISMLKY